MPPLVVSKPIAESPLSNCGMVTDDPKRLVVVRIVKRKQIPRGINFVDTKVDRPLALGRAAFHQLRADAAGIPSRNDLDKVTVERVQESDYTRKRDCSRVCH